MKDRGHTRKGGKGDSKTCVKQSNSSRSKSSACKRKKEKKIKPTKGSSLVRRFRFFSGRGNRSQSNSPETSKTRSHSGKRSGSALNTPETRVRTSSGKRSRSTPKPRNRAKSRSHSEKASSFTAKSQNIEAGEQTGRDLEMDRRGATEERGKISEMWRNADAAPVTQFLLTIPPMAWSFFSLVMCFFVKILFICFIFGMLTNSYDGPLIFLMCFLLILIGSSFTTVQVLTLQSKTMILLCGSVDAAIILVTSMVFPFISSKRNGDMIIPVQRVGGTTVIICFLEILLLLNFYHLQFGLWTNKDETPDPYPPSVSFSGKRLSRTKSANSVHVEEGKSQRSTPESCARPRSHHQHDNKHRRHQPHHRRHQQRHHHRPEDCPFRKRSVMPIKKSSGSEQENTDNVALAVHNSSAEASRTTSPNLEAFHAHTRRGDEIRPTTV